MKNDNGKAIFDLSRLYPSWLGDLGPTGRRTPRRDFDSNNWNSHHTLTITVQTAGVKAVDCQGEVTTFDGGHGYSVTTTVAGTASGATRTCTISVPYSWVLATPTTDSLSISYIVSASTGATPLGRTSAETPLATVKVPANGTNTKESAALTI